MSYTTLLISGFGPLSWTLDGDRQDTTGLGGRRRVVVSTVCGVLSEAQPRSLASLPALAGQGGIKQKERQASRHVFLDAGPGYLHQEGLAYCALTACKGLERGGVGEASHRAFG